MKRFGTVALACAVTLFAGAGVANAGGGKIANGDFAQQFKNWKTDSYNGDYYGLFGTGGTLLPAEDCPIVGELPEARSVWSPYSNHCADPGTIALYRTLKVPKKAKAIELYFFYFNYAGPDAFNYGGSWSSFENQYFSIDLLKKSAAFSSSAKSELIANVFKPSEGTSPESVGWTKRSTKIPKKYRGKSIKLRHIASVFEAPIMSGIDDVKFKLKK